MYMALLCFAFVGIGCAQVALSSEIPAYQGYRLVWNDEFDRAGKPDPAKWTYELGYRRNKEAQWYQPDNAICRNGKLVITAKREKKPNPEWEPDATGWKKSRRYITYTSASVTTKGLHAWQYGRFEFRAKIDIDAGMWPAIWMLGANRDQAGWPESGEIDIMEYYRGMLLANTFHANAKGKPIGNVFKKDLKKLTGKDPKKWASRYHVWRMDWDENQIKFFVDDQLLSTVDITKTVNKTPDKSNPFRQPHYLIMNVAVGGKAGGDPKDTRFPRRMMVDYVRIYQRTSTGDTKE